MSWKRENQRHAMAARKIKTKGLYGLAKKKGIAEKDVDPKELEMGIKVEMEHTNDKRIAKQIALDHLAEYKHYYSNLKKYEKTFNRSPEDGLLDNFFGGM